jgi:hypothetical protein
LREAWQKLNSPAAWAHRNYGNTTNTLSPGSADSAAVAIILPFTRSEVGMSKKHEPRTMTVPIDPSLEPDWDQLEAFTASLPDNDGVPSETPWHWAQSILLVAMVYCRYRGRTDFFSGGNMFIYYSREQAMSRDYRGPDFFFVNHVDGTRPRRFWALWQEGGPVP